MKLIIIGDEAFEKRMKDHYDHVIDIISIEPRPQMGWLYHLGEFLKFKQN